MTLEYSLLAPIQELERAYQFFNRWLFDNELNEKVIITIQTRGRRSNALAWYWQRRWDAERPDHHAKRDGDSKESDKSEAIAEINFSAETLRTSDAYESLIHEMVHHYCAIKGIRDCSRNGKYHNKRFKEAAESAGLICQRDEKIGWAYTCLGEKANQAKTDLIPKPEVFKYLRYEEAPANRKKKLKKWKCLCYSFWSEANNQIEAKCLHCNEVFVDG